MKNGAIDAHMCEKITHYINEKPIPACFGFQYLDWTRQIWLLVLASWVIYAFMLAKNTWSIYFAH